MREALDGAMPPDRAAAVLSMALMRAALREIPEELIDLNAFVQGPLRSVLESFAGREVMEACLSRLSHVLWMASSTVRAHAASPDELAAAFEGHEREEPSGLRPVDPSTSAPKPPTESGPRRSPTLGRLAMTQLKTGGVREVSVVLAPARGPVLVISLDGALVKQVERELAGARRVVHVSSQAELLRTMTAARTQGFAVLVDSALPSVELRVFASYAPMMPAGTRVVLWGTDTRQMKRLCTVFPQASAWIASDAATSTAELLADDD